MLMTAKSQTSATQTTITSEDMDIWKFSLKLSTVFFLQDFDGMSICIGPLRMTCFKKDPQVDKNG